jgi:hypothetical protein
MVTKLIELEDGTLVEIEAMGDQVQEISGGFADKVNATFDKVKPLLIKACRPIVAACQELNKEISIDKAEVELGLNFEGEGNLYITKSKAGANLKITLKFKPKNNELR